MEDISVTNLESITPDLKALAKTYLTPNSPRKIVRRPRFELEPTVVQVPFGDGSLSVRSWGDGEPVLLIHGWAANQQDMFNFVPEVVRNGFRAVTMDLPAHGESSGELAGLEELGEGVAAVSNFLGELSGLIAHSAGAAAAQVALSKGVFVPRIVLLASPNNYEAGARQFARAQGLSDSEVDKFVGTLEAMNVKVAIKSVDLIPPVNSVALIIHSSDDLVVPVSSAEHLHILFLKSELLIVDKLGHRGVLKDVSVVSRAVDFLKT